MNTLKKITTLFLVSISINLLAQDSLLQTELTFYPLYHQKIESGFGKEYLFINKHRYGPTLLLNFPLNNKLSLSTGLNFQINSYEYYFNDSVEIDYNQLMSSFELIYIYKHKSSSLDILVPILINYKLLQYKKFNISIAGGIETDLWYFFAGTTEFYPIKKTNKTGGYSNRFNSLVDNATYNINVNTTLKYFPIKHWGVLIKPFASYNLAFDKYSLKYGLGVGICYR
jgi:hypothetical protein